MGEANGGADSTVHETIRSYYDALRTGDPLSPFFVTDDTVVKFGISERLVGGDDVAAGLREQTETTTAWSVDSHDLRVTERSEHAWFADLVSLAWTSTDRPVRYEFETRWSGMLERRDETGTPTRHGSWRFVGMHVSTARDL